jgi:hypothetical protein
LIFERLGHAGGGLCEGDTALKRLPEGGEGGKSNRIGHLTAEHKHPRHASLEAQRHQIGAIATAEENKLRGGVLKGRAQAIPGQQLPGGKGQATAKADAGFPMAEVEKGIPAARIRQAREHRSRTTGRAVETGEGDTTLSV